MNHRFLIPLALCLSVSWSAEAQVEVLNKCNLSSDFLIGMRVGEKIYAKDTVYQGKLRYKLDPGFYALVRQGVLLGDFIVTESEQLQLVVYCDSIAAPQSEVNNVFSKFIKSPDTAKAGIYSSAQGPAKQVLGWCYPQLLVPSLPKEQLTSLGLNAFFSSICAVRSPF